MRKRSAGFTYVALLFAVAVIGGGLASIGSIWYQTAQREKEEELLFIGGQFRQAIASYYEQTPSGAKQYPQRLEDLVADKRGIVVRHHLRRIYRDPLTKRHDWGLVQAPGGGIMGVYTLSQEIPLKKSNFRQVDSAFEGKNKYSEWQFIYRNSNVVF